MFSNQQLKTTFNLMSQADETILHSIMASLRMDQLKKVLRSVERSIKNKDPLSDCLCCSCHMHAVNMEDGIDVCDSCLSE